VREAFVRSAERRDREDGVAERRLAFEQEATGPPDGGALVEPGLLLGDQDEQGEGVREV